MAEEERILSLSEKEGTDTSQSKDTYILEESIPDISISLLNIQMPETPDSTKGQASDGDTSRLESPKAVKPVLGKVQAKKRLMAFANQFKALPKSQVKSNLSQHSTGTLKTKDKTVQDDININKSKKKTEEKILAIEEIRREESKSKMLLAEAIAAASMEDENYIGKNISSSFESKRHMKEKKHERMNNDHKNRSINQKYSERSRQRDKINKDNQDVKDRNGSIEQITQKSSQNRRKHKKDKKKKSKDKRDNSKTDTNRDKKVEGKNKKENEKEKQEETKEKTEATKSKKENIKDKRNDMSEMEVEGKDKKEKDKWKEKMLLKSNSWAEIRKSGLTLDDIIHLRRRDNSERSIKIRTMHDYTRCFEQMLMLSNHRLKRQALIAEGLDGPKKFPPESIKLTKRAKGLQLLYCENPRISLLLGISQLLQAVTPERREKIRDICEASLPRIDTEDIVQQKRNWYQQLNTFDYHKDTRWQMTIQLPKSKWDSEDEEISSINVTKEEIEKPVNKLHFSVNQQERCSMSNITDEDKIDNNAESVKEDNKCSEKISIENITNEASMSSLLQPAGNEKLASEYEQFMKMVCTATDVTKEYSPKENSVKSTASPRSYHEFNIESNLIESNTNMKISLKDKFEKNDKIGTLEESIKITECEQSTLSTNSQIQVNENNIQIEHTIENDESQDSKSIPSDWENVRIKVERLSDENTESREVKKKKKKKMTSSDSSSNITSSDSEKEKKKRKHKRKVLSNSSSDSDSTDSSSSSSDSSSSEERRKRKRKKKKIGKKRKKAKHTARIKKKRRRKMSIDSNSSDSDEHTNKKKRTKKKIMETKSINNGDIRKIISKSPVSSSDGTKILQSVTPIRKIKEEVTGEDRKKSDQVISSKKITDMSVHDNECLKQKKEKKENKSDENFIEQWEMDSMTMQQNDDKISSQDHTEELGKMDLEKSKCQRKRKYNRDNVEQDKDRSSKANEERIYEGKASSDEEIEVKRKKRKEKDIKSSSEFLANWERENERITQRIQNEDKYLKKLEKQKKEKWGETDFDTLNVPSLTQLEKEVCQKQLLADEWEVDSLEAISDLIISKRKNNQDLLKKTEKEVRYDKKTDTYIAIEKESVREMKKKQERLYAIRIWEEEQEEGEREEIMLLEQKNKRKTDDWDIEEESLFRKSTEKIEVCKINDIITIQKEWTKTDENKDIKEDTNKLNMKLGKRVKKSRWDMGSQSEEKSELKDIWQKEYVEWSKINKYEQEFEKTKKDEFRPIDSESSNKLNLLDFYHRKSQSRESFERSWASDEMAIRPVQAKNNALIKQLIPKKTNEEQFAFIKDQIGDQFKEISESDIKFKEKTYAVELYSPSSPAFSQKSQDVEISNESKSCNSLLREKRKKKMLITADELSIPIPGIPLQLIKLRDTKHTSSEKIENILNKVQLEDKNSARNFNAAIKAADNLFDDISINKSCSKIHSSGHMDIFAEYGSEKSCDKQHTANSTVNLAMHMKDDEMNEGKNALKLIPKQLLIRRTNEQIKPKHILKTPLQDPAQHAAALLTIQKKLLESHALKNDIKYPNPEQTDYFEQRYSNKDIVASNSRSDNTLLDTTEFSVVSKASVIAIRQSRSPEKTVSIRSEQSKNYDKESKNIKRYKTNRNLSDINVSSSIRSPIREHRKRSPSKKESEKRYLNDKDKKERKSVRTFDDIEKPDRRNIRSSKIDYTDRKRSSPSVQERRRKSRSPYVSWECQRSESRSSDHSWSRSRSKSPRRKDEATNSTRDKDKKRERYDDERSCRSRIDERKEKYMRSPSRFDYNEDNFKKGIIYSKSNRNDWDRRKHDNMDNKDHEKNIRLYNPIEILRERTMESEKYRDNRFHTDELDHMLCQYEKNILRDGNESMDSYTVGQDLSLEYDDRSYYREGSLERGIIQSSPQLLSKYRRRANVKKERQWEKDKDSLDLAHSHRLRNRTSPRSRYSPVRQAPERFRRKSRSRSRSWSPLRSRTRSRSRSGSRSKSTRSRPKIRSQSRSRSKSPFNIRGKSVSISRLRSPEYSFRMSELRSSRSPSPGRDRLNEIGREKKNDDENKKFNVCGEKGRRIETIVQSGIMPETNILASEMDINSMDTTVTNFLYSNEIEGGSEYYYTENNLTYPPCMDESSTSSPKRLSLDDRLELELGIKKQHSKDSTGVVSEYSSTFNPNVIAYPSSPPQQQQMMYRQPTVVQVGNVLQVVPADFNGVQSVHREVSTAVATPSVRSGSSQVVRVGNVLQVVPTSLDWSSKNSGSGDQSTTTDQSSGVLYSSAVSAHSPSASISVPIPVPLPVPPALPIATNTLAPIVTMSPVTPLPLSLPVPVPMPIPIPSTTAIAFSRNEIQPQKIIQPVYNYEAILETRRKEQEERKRLRELRRKEKERRRIERINRRALRLLEKNNTSQQMSEGLLDHRKNSNVDLSVLKALKGDEQVDSPINPIKEEEEVAIFIKEEDEDANEGANEEEDEDEVEAEAEMEDDEEEEEAEDEDEDDDDDEKPLQINQRIEVDEATTSIDATKKDQAEVDIRKEWPKLPPPPLKGILLVSGFSPNSNLDDLSDADDNIKDGNNIKTGDKDEEINKNNEHHKDVESDAKSGKSNLAKLKKRNKKSVQFADGVKPGEGTSPSGGEGDMPSPPPPKGIDFREGLGDLRRDKIYSCRKNRKQEKRIRPPKTKKKVKVKIIKLKKPRITSLTAMMMDDSDEMDDRSPPPPPPGSPPPPHLWPSYLSIYNTTIRAIEQPQTTTLISVQPSPPPTPLPLLIPPPPLNYTIQPCSKS